ncbi:MAG: hypothetical protein WCT99_07705 [Bacteroidota bacterium]|jgi:hypothetical protein
MSWIIGIYGRNITPGIIDQIENLHSSPLFRIKEDHHCFILSGGNPETLHYHRTQDGFIVAAGLGIDIQHGRAEIVSTDTWRSMITQESNEWQQKLNGQFVALSFTKFSMNFFSDRVGLRTMYFARTDHGIMFSTRLTWLTQFLSSSSIDWKIFGSKWTSVNQFSYRALLQKIDRLPPNGHIVIKNDSLTIDQTPWITPMTVPGSTGETKQLLSSLLRMPERHLKLGLSGGLDSRTLLAVLTSETKNFSTYSFGDEKEPDNILSKKIATEENCTHHNYSFPFPSQEKCLHLLRSYIQQSNLTAPAFGALQSQYYPYINAHTGIQIDGGGGEIARRQLLNRLLVWGRRDVYDLHPERILSRLKTHRGDFFTDEINHTMIDGAVEDLDGLLHRLPNPALIGIEHFLDLWGAQITIPNVACDEQARIDEHTINFMPFSQPDFMNNVLQLPVRFRKNNRLFKEIIREKRPSLTKYPLIKNGVVYPYRLSMIQARLWMKAASVVRPPFRNELPHRFLLTTKEFVLDTVHSSDVKNYQPYNYDKILAMITAYYRGEERFVFQINWWIAFDVWRRMVEK